MLADIESFLGGRIGAGTLYAAITRLVDKGWITPESVAGRQRPYRLTAAGTACLEELLRNMRRVARIGLERLRLA
jgi:DNA-binding PadR family transcriptional regulator